VEAEKVAQVLAAANAAPSAGNLQGYPAEEPEPTPRRSLTDLVHEVVHPDVPAGETGVRG
jgi:nitroreductase